jgi:hypothetical protein
MDVLGYLWKMKQFEYVKYLYQHKMPEKIIKQWFAFWETGDTNVETVKAGIKELDEIKKKLKDDIGLNIR